MPKISKIAPTNANICIVHISPSRALVISLSISSFLFSSTSEYESACKIAIFFATKKRRPKMYS